MTLGDVAKVEIGPEDDRRVTRFNGKTSVTIGIIKQATANPLDVSPRRPRRLAELMENLPAGMDAVIANDTTVFIERSIAAVFTTIAEAVGPRRAGDLLFLRSFRAAIIPVVTIPVSLVAHVRLDVRLRLLDQHADAAGPGAGDRPRRRRCDRRAGERPPPHRGRRAPFDAAMVGTREIGFAIIAMTLTLAAVYAPIAFTPGRPGGCSSSSRWPWPVRCWSRASWR